MAEAELTPSDDEKRVPGRINPRPAFRSAAASVEGDRHARPPLDDEIGRKAVRRLKARRTQREGVWFGLGMFGLVGWSVAIPTVLGALLGLWLDRRFPEGPSWTIMLIVGGLAIGCLNAWRWLRDESELR